MIKLDKKTHTYSKGKTKYISVTTLISKFFKEFNPTEIARLLAKYPNNKSQKHGVRYWKKLWKEQQEYGTLIHSDIQKCIINESDTSEYPETRHALQFFNTYIKGLDCHSQPERIITNEEFKIAGTIDLAIFHGDGYVTVVDWKVVKNINKKSRDGTINELGMEDCNYNKYALQLNMYAWMLSELGYKIFEMKLVQLTKDAYKVYDIPNMFYEIPQLLEGLK